MCNPPETTLNEFLAPENIGLGTLIAFIGGLFDVLWAFEDFPIVTS